MYFSLFNVFMERKAEHTPCLSVEKKRERERKGFVAPVFLEIV